jgi:predicted transcriptional regulator
MTIVAGKVVNGRIEVADVELTEGADVAVYIHDADAYELTEQEEAELEESIAQIARGEYVDGDTVIEELRRRRGL